VHGALRWEKFLHGNTQPHIDEYDTLTSTDMWDDNVSCVLANPPF
jgi:type I restriction enzyme M protein